MTGGEGGEPGDQHPETSVSIKYAHANKNALALFLNADI